MFLASHICCVSSGTDMLRYWLLPREVSGAKPTWRGGKGKAWGAACVWVRASLAHGGAERPAAQTPPPLPPLLPAQPPQPPHLTHHEEVEAGEGDEVDSQLAQVGVQLAGEAQAAGDA